MKKNKIDIEIKKHYKNSDRFSREELFQFYRKYEPDLKETTFRWRLYDLKKQGTIVAIKRGVFKIADKPIYTQTLGEDLKELYKTATEAFFEEKFVIWSTAWINEFSRHQTFNNLTILEAPVDMTESLFNVLKDYGVSNVFLKPTSEQIYNYAIGAEKPILIKNLILKAPIQNYEQFVIPTMEKILVDLYCDNKTFYMYRGSELEEIFRNALNKYSINYTKLLQYGRRRGKINELKQYLLENFKQEIGDILDDK